MSDYATPQPLAVGCDVLFVLLIGWLIGFFGFRYWRSKSREVRPREKTFSELPVSFDASYYFRDGFVDKAKHDLGCILNQLNARGISGISGQTSVHVEIINGGDGSKLTDFDIPVSDCVTSVFVGLIGTVEPQNQVRFVMLNKE